MEFQKIIRKHTWKRRKASIFPRTKYSRKHKYNQYFKQFFHKDHKVIRSQKNIYPSKIIRVNTVDM